MSEESAVVEIKSKEQFDKALKDEQFKATVVDFTATWCGPCKHIKPYFKELSAAHKEVQFLLVDVDELESVASEAGVSAMPTFHVYIKGKKESELVGASREKLLALIVEASGQAQKKTEENKNEHGKSDEVPKADESDEKK